MTSRCQIDTRASAQTTVPFSWRLRYSGQMSVGATRIVRSATKKGATRLSRLQTLLLHRGLVPLLATAGAMLVRRWRR